MNFKLLIQFWRGVSFLAELLNGELGLRHVWELGFRDVVSLSNCREVVDVLTNDINLDRYWLRENITTN